MSRSISILKSKNIIFLSIILSIVFLSYLPVLKADFVQWDDDVHLLNNITIRSLNYDYVQRMFKDKINDIYVPLTTLSFALEYRLFGLDPFFYHLDNLILHLFIIVLIYLIGRQLGLSEFGSAAGALIFGIHPIHVESVAWVTERKDVLYGFFYMAAVFSYLKYLGSSQPREPEEKKNRFLILTTMLGTLSILAKPMALSLPLVLLLLDWFKGRRFERRVFVEKAPLALLIGAIVLVTYKSFARVPGMDLTEGILVWSWTFIFYFRQFLFPFFSVPVYRLPEAIGFLNPEYSFSLLLTMIILLTLFRFRKYRWYIFAVLFFFLSIFFLLRFDATRDTNIVADRFMYLPSVGFCLMIGLGIERAWKGFSEKTSFSRIGLMTGLAVLVLILSCKTFQQCYVWKDSISLWKHQLKYFPNEQIALNNLATVLRDQKPYRDAIGEYKKILKIKAEGLDVSFSKEAIEKLARVEELVSLYAQAIKANPGFVDAYYNLASLYRDLGDISSALASYQKVIALDSRYKDAYINLGDIFRDVGDVRSAIEAYKQTIQVQPNDEDVYFNVLLSLNEALERFPENIEYKKARTDVFERYTSLINSKSAESTSFFNLGNIYSQMKEYDRAISAYQMALDINPIHAGVLYNLGNVYKDSGRYKEAIAVYERSNKIDPANADCYINLGVVHGRLGNLDKAQKYYKEAAEVDPNNATAVFNLAYVQEELGKLIEAVDSYKRSIELDHDNPEAHYNLGNVYVSLKMANEAKESYLNAIQLDPTHLDATVNLSVLSYRMSDFKSAIRYCDEAILFGYDAPIEYLKALAEHRR